MGTLNRLRRWWTNLLPGGGGRRAGPAGGGGEGGGPTTTGPGGGGEGGGPGAGGAGAGGGGRVRGEPTSTNGASSFHLFWDLPGELASVAATLEVRQAPSVERLYFWALQAEFTEAGRRGGAGHLGLQFHPDCPDRTAANWGGYDQDGRVLDGSTSALPSSLGNPHTRDFDWKAGRRYRLSIEAAPPVDQPGGDRTAWRGTITDLGDGRVTVVRDLLARGSRLVQPMVWSEVFARCEHPAAEVRWSDLQATTAAGRLVRPASVRVNYQGHADGGCANTNAWTEDGAVVQRTATDRSTPPSTRLDLPVVGS